jgi:hypothetical protein
MCFVEAFQLLFSRSVNTVLCNFFNGFLYQPPCQKATMGMPDCVIDDMQTVINSTIDETIISPVKPAKLWMPKRVVFTPEALEEPFAQKIYERVSNYNLPVEIMKNNRVTGLRGRD